MTKKIGTLVVQMPTSVSFDFYMSHRFKYLNNNSILRWCTVNWVIKEKLSKSDHKISQKEKNDTKWNLREYARMTMIVFLIKVKNCSGHSKFRTDSCELALGAGPPQTVGTSFNIFCSDLPTAQI